MQLCAATVCNDLILAQGVGRLPGPGGQDGGSDAGPRDHSCPRSTTIPKPPGRRPSSAGPSATQASSAAGPSGGALCHLRQRAGERPDSDVLCHGGAGGDQRSVKDGQHPETTTSISTTSTTIFTMLQAHLLWWDNPWPTEATVSSVVLQFSCRLLDILLLWPLRHSLTPHRTLGK